MAPRFRILTCALVAAVAIAACGGDDPADPASPSPGVVTEETATATPTVEPTATATPTTAATDSDAEPTAAPAADGDALPGEVIEIFPYEGAELGVVGVQADDTLNVRSGPGVSFAVVDELAPLADGVRATGHNRQLDDGAVWAELAVGGVTGWANTAFLSHLGVTEDVTSQLFPATSDRPRAETMLELGQIVAEQVASEEPSSRITVVDGPTVGDLGEITVDVIGLADDAVGGLRLHVFAEPDPGGESFTVRTVEQTTLCTRGVTDGGLCV